MNDALWGIGKREAEMVKMGIESQAAETTSTWETYKKTAIPPKDSDHFVFEMARKGDLSHFLQLDEPRRFIHTRNEKGHTLLMLVCYHGHLSFAETLIALGSDVNSVDDSGNSILMGVSFKGHLDIVKALVFAGADVSYKNPKGQSAFDYSVLFGRKEVSEFLAKNMVNHKKTQSQILSWIKFFYNTTRHFFSNKSSKEA